MTTLAEPRAVIGHPSFLQAPLWPTEAEVLELAEAAKRLGSDGDLILWDGGSTFAVGYRFFPVRTLYRLLRRAALKPDRDGSSYYTITETGLAFLERWRAGEEPKT